MYIASISTLFDYALWFSAAGHFLILLASFQVPARLGWKEDLPKLIPFNRKLIWKGGAFIVITIVAFGLLTLYLHDEMIEGNSVALGIATFIGFFWALRVVVDLFYFSHEDWPEGRMFFVGHLLLTILFSGISLTYLSLCCWHIFKEL